MDKPLIFKVRRGLGVSLTVTQPDNTETSYGSSLDWAIQADAGEHNIVGRRKLIVAALQVLLDCSTDELEFADKVIFERRFRKAYHGMIKGALSDG